MIQFLHIYKKYGLSSNFALEDITISIPNNNITGIIGHNGAGKTSLFMIANGLSKPSNGNVIIDNYSLSSNRRKIQSVTGLFTEKLHLYPLLTVRECLNYFLGVYRIPQSRYQYFVSTFKLKDFENKKISILSTGMLKKVLLAVSIINNPSVLFLDEPFSGLDPEARNDFVHLIKEIHVNNNIQLLISSHELLELEALIDQLVVLKNGKVIVDDSLGNLMSKYFAQRMLKIEIYTPDIKMMNQSIKEAFSLSTRKPPIIERLDKNVYRFNIVIEYSHLIFSNLPYGSRILSVVDFKPSLDDLYFKIND